jgi:hypothetical protein
VKPKVFVIHGRDIEARDELVKLLDALGLQHHSFERVAARLGAAPFVADIVIRGIRDAAVVIALFTPEEHATFYDPVTAEYRGTAAGEARWQARPNVIFEAGVALGVARKRTILATLGSDVQLFSDVSGVHFVSLAGADGKQMLRDRIEQVLGAPLEVDGNWESAADFRRILRQRWRHFDELHDMEVQLANCFLGDERLRLLDVVAAVARANTKRDWRRSTAEEFVGEIKRIFKGKHITDDAYWWLIVHGFFRFRDIDKWFVGADPSWKQSVEFTALTDRSLALIEKLRVVGGLTPRGEPTPAVR